MKNIYKIVVFGFLLIDFRLDASIPLTKEELRQQLQIMQQEIVAEIKYSSGEKLSKEVALALTAILTGVGLGGWVCGDPRRSIRSDEDLELYLMKFGLWAFIGFGWAAFVLGAIDKKLINSTSDLEKKIKALAELEMLIKSLDKK